MSSIEISYIRQGQYFKKDGDVEFTFQTYDGIGLPQFPSAKSPGGYQKRINDIINLDTRPDDVLLATYPKCGTNWGYEILNMLLHGNTSYTKDNKAITMLEAIGDLSVTGSAQSPRVLNSHLPYKWFPKKHISNGGKIIHITRNPKDAYVSYYYQLRNTLSLGMKTENITWSQYFKTSVMNKGIMYGSWFDYEKEMQQAKKDNKNIYTVHFENLKEKPEIEIKGIADFLNLKVSDSFIPEIAYKCQFQNLKKAREETNKTSEETRKFFMERQKLSPGYKPPLIYRKGIVGDWKNHFTVLQNEQFNALYEKEMADTNLPVIYEI